VDQWLANRSSDMTLLWLSENDLSCVLPDSTGIGIIISDQETAGGGASTAGTLSLLEGNLFRCPLPRGVLPRKPTVTLNLTRAGARISTLLASFSVPH